MVEVYLTVQKMLFGCSVSHERWSNGQSHFQCHLTSFAHILENKIFLNICRYIQGTADCVWTFSDSS